MPRARTDLERILDRDALAAFVEAVQRAAPPDAWLTVEPVGSDGDAGGDANGVVRGPADGGGRTRPLVVDGARVALLRAADDMPDDLLELAAIGLELAAREAAARRAVAIEALEAYRELALLYRVAERIGATLDAAAIGPAVLDEARRVLQADAAAIVPVGAGDAGHDPVPASTVGAQPAVADLLRRARGAIERATRTGTAETAADEGRTFVVAPLSVPDGTRGAMVLGRNGRPFASGDVKLIVALAQNAAIAFERTALHAANAQRLQLEHDLALGRRIQLGLLPQTLPRPDGWEIGAAYEPAREVGGDFYDVHPVRGRSRSMALVIADVTGKGIPAALMMAFARPLLRAASDHSAGPADALARANRILVEERRASLFITALHLRVQLRTGVLTWAAAGHDPPLLVPGDGGRVRRLPAGGTLLGARIDPACAEHEMRLRPGDLVVAYTDGVTDARRSDGVRFGDDRLTRAARAAGGLDAEAAARSIREAVHRFTAGAPAADDLAVLTLRRTPARRPRAVRVTEGRRADTQVVGAGAAAGASAR